MLKPAPIVFLPEVYSSFQDRIVEFNIPVFLLAEPTNPHDDKAIIIAADLFAATGCEPIYPEKMLIKVGYMRRNGTPLNPFRDDHSLKEEYWEYISIVLKKHEGHIERKYYQDTCRTLHVFIPHWQ